MIRNVTDLACPQSSALVYDNGYSLAKAVTLSEFVLGTFVIPTFTEIATTWLGASIVVAQYNYTAPSPFQVSSDFINNNPAPPNATFLPVICYRDGALKYRYKLWDDEDALLFEPLYNKEQIQPNFSIEIWTVEGQNPVLASALTISTSLRTCSRNATSYEVSEASDVIDVDSPDLNLPLSYGADVPHLDN